MSMKTYIFLFVCLLNCTYICASNDTLDTNDELMGIPISTPIYLGKTLFCQSIEKPILYSSFVKDTVQVLVQFQVHFDVTSAEANRELTVLDITNLKCMRYSVNMPFEVMSELAPAFREELLTWHWWLGDYLNPLTLYPSEVCVIQFLILPNKKDNNINNENS